MKLYVGNLSFDSSESDVRDLFAPFGDLTSVAIITDRDTGRPRGFGFVEFASSDAARRAVDELNGKEFGGRSLNVNEARDREPRGGGGGGHRGGGGGRGGRGGW